FWAGLINKSSGNLRTKEQDNQRSLQETKGWDVFRVLPPSTDTGSNANQKTLELIMKILKVFAYLFTFVIVLVAGVIAKGTLLMMTSQIKKGRDVAYCGKDLARDQAFYAKLPTEENVVWTWCLIFTFLVPEIFTLFRASRIVLFKSWRRPPFSDFVIVWMFESFHIIGIGLLMFAVLPHLDVVQGAMITNCVCLVPGVLGMLSRSRKESKRSAKILVDIFSILAQLTGLLLWPIILAGKDGGSHLVWSLPVSLLLTSCGWWENYADKHSPFAIVKSLGRVKERLKRTRYFTYIFISIWKIALFLGTVFFIWWGIYKDLTPLFSKFNLAFGDHKIPVYSGPLRSSLVSDAKIDRFQTFEAQDAWSSTPSHVLTIQIFSAWLCYVFGKFACKICIQGFSFAFPVNLIVPVSVSLLIAACGVRNNNACILQGTLPDYLFFECPTGDFLNDLILSQHAWVWLLWLLSQTWITLHIWTPKCERLASTEKLFISPFYNAFLLDQGMGLMRRRDDEGDVKTEELELDIDATGDGEMGQYYETISIHTETSSTVPKTVKASDSITQIYACATMWHETTEEMVEMLKSIFRMDEDQSARRVAQKYLKIVDPDYYKFETHIFFDDCFEASDDNDEENVINMFVKQLINTMDEAASHVHQTNIRIRPPKKYPTPYGGRLEWILPGKTKMYAHLKDKSKIRHRKRWSQVMYMYYLLGFRLMDRPISVDRKEVIAENTYLLTLDGDIDFQPVAVQLLVDLMKKNRNLGAACGRIHPVGSGPMMWYQLFEYAIGHWLQKATEHMIGCVLCSPGCFSLFRGKALMDDNVMRRYTTKSDEPRHYVQYDQGEDRWLCTLLLQRGYRVEYSAASDAFTHCPEGFNEFYNQRRRWVPSTIANIMDLLVDYKRTVKINDNISVPYIFYQMMLMGGTILGPGTIFLMLVGAFVAAFRIDNWTSFTYNLYPIVAFMFICFTCKSEWQLVAAQLLSAAYALIMMAVIVGTALQLGEDGIGSPSAIFLIALSGSFFIAACIHPQEFYCIIPGLLYLLLIPSMYLLLILYSIINLNNVSWGTREMQTKKSTQELEEEKKEAEEAQRQAKEKSLLGLIHKTTAPEEEGSIDFSFANLFRCMLCTHRKPIDEKQQLVRIAESLEVLTKRLDSIERMVDPTGVAPGRRRSASRSSNRGAHAEHLGALTEEESDDEVQTHKSKDDHDAASISTQKEQRDDLINPYWIEDKGLKRGPVDYLDGPEVQFWVDLIEKYLYPIDADKKAQAKIAEALKELRTKSVFFFFMVNALFILIVFLMQLNKDSLNVHWPLGVKINTTLTDDGRLIIDKEYLQLEPIGLVFVFFFGLILVIQFTAMLFHRFGTISHILASTELTCCNRKIEDISDDAFIDKNAIDIARNLQKLRGLDGDQESENGSGGDRIGRRRTIHNLEKQRQKKRAIGTLDVAFKKRFFSISAEAGVEETPAMSQMRKLSMTRETIKALELRRNTVLGERKKSTMQTLGANNEFNKSKHGPRHRSSTALVDGTAERIFTPNGDTNNGYDESSDDDRMTTRSSVKLHPLTPAGRGGSWKEVDNTRKNSPM
ncbi:hypothetical protein QYM36_001381, partial [Artemia franciscana]